MNEFTQEEVEKLINLVSLNTVLYDSRVLDYNNLHLKDILWSEIALTLNKSNDSCKRQWKMIRDGYVRYKRINNLSSSTKKPRNWLTYNMLGFLDPVVQPPKKKRPYKDNDTKHAITANILQHEPNDNKTLQLEPNDNKTLQLEPNDNKTLQLEPNDNKTLQQELNDDETEDKLQSDIITEMQQYEDESILLTNEYHLSDSDNYQSTIANNICLTDDGQINVHVLVPTVQTTSFWRDDSLDSSQNEVQNDVQHNILSSTNNPDDVDSFTTYTKDVLKLLPPVIQIQAKQEIFNILSKYQMMLVEQEISPGNNNIQNNTTDMQFELKNNTTDMQFVLKNNTTDMQFELQNNTTDMQFEITNNTTDMPFEITTMQDTN